MQKANVPRSKHTNQATSLCEPDFDKVLLECEYVLVAPGGKSSGSTLPDNLPIISRAPAVFVDEKGKVSVAEQEL